MSISANRKAIETFVAKQIRSHNEPDDSLLHDLIDQLDPGELKAYWQALWTQAARSEANAVPDWKTKERQRAYESALTRHAFTAPSDDLKLGALREHIWVHLKSHIAMERTRRAAFKALPWIARFHARLSMAIVLGAWLVVPLLLVGAVVIALFHFNPGMHAENSIKLIVFLLWAAYLVTGVVVTWWLRRRNRSVGSA